MAAPVGRADQAEGQGLRRCIKITGRRSEGQQGQFVAGLVANKGEDRGPVDPRQPLDFLEGERPVVDADIVHCALELTCPITLSTDAQGCGIGGDAGRSGTTLIQDPIDVQLCCRPVIRRSHVCPGATVDRIEIGGIQSIGITSIEANEDPLG